MTKGSQVTQLEEWNYEYELLTNELFHLRQFTSLVEFDPAYRNESELFKTFLDEAGFGLRLTESKADNELEESNATRRVRRHQMRELGAKGAKRLQELEQAVAEKYFELETSLRSFGCEFKVQRPKDKEKDYRKRRVRPVSEHKEGKRRRTTRGEGSDSLLVPDTGEFLDEPVKECDDTCVMVAGDSEEEDSFYFTTSSEDEDNNVGRICNKKRKYSRINIIVHPPVRTITNPLHVVKPLFQSLHEFLDSYKSLDEDLTLEQYEQYIVEQKKMHVALRRGLECGILKYDSVTDSIQGIGLKDVQSSHGNKSEPVSTYYKEQEKLTLHDHIVNFGTGMSKLFQERRRVRISRARKISQMIEQHFRHVAGAEERKTKEEEKRRRALARTAIQAVKKRWNLAERAFRVLKKDEEEQLKRIQGKRHLSKMLEKSTQLLGAQLNQYENISSESLTDYSDSRSSGSDELITTSFSDSDTEEQHQEGDDSSLTIEELKKKYSELNHSNMEPSSSKLPSQREDSRSEDEKQDQSENEKILTNTAEGNGGSIIDAESDFSSISEELDCNSSSLVSEASDDVAETKHSNLSIILSNVDGEESDEEVQLSSKDSDQINGLSDKEIQEKRILSESNTSSESPGMGIGEPMDLGNSNPNRVKDRPKSSSESLSVIDVPNPSLLRGTLRTYQKQGLNWLASLYNNNTNGILADEMGLGKTIQTISLLAYLACEKENWGPHLIVVPTSVLLNWEMEFKRFAPGFKVLSYYGSLQQRKEKRKGWNKPDSFHVCVTSYQLVVHDQYSFKRKKWRYMILDEAHNIKNFRSTRWQALLHFNTERRLLLTGTPLQNNIAELWSLLYFLMPQTALENGNISGFADLAEFQQWFGKPVDKIIATEGKHDAETKQTVSKLHQVLRPYLLRRLKADVEKQMPAKYEHIVTCRLSKRQRFLYDDFMSRAQTKATLASGNFMSIINCLMQLRKVCNHPDLFEVRPILTSFCVDTGVASKFKYLNLKVLKKLNENIEKRVNLRSLNLLFTENDFNLTTNTAQFVSKFQCVQQFVDAINKIRSEAEIISKDKHKQLNYQDIHEFYKGFTIQKSERIIDHYKHVQYVNNLRCEKKPVYGTNLINHLKLNLDSKYKDTEIMSDLMRPLETRLLSEKNTIEDFAIITPNVVVLGNRELALGLNDGSIIDPTTRSEMIHSMRTMANPLHILQTKLSIAFPDKSLLQYDCGKLQKLATLLIFLKENGHRALIFTQMTKVLDILEQFLNYHGYLYLRLDGATKIQDRQILTERFNSDPRITVFILSSRSGGLGINLTGADTVIFYDSDWNPAMDKQCQDRCHRIGQTRDVHIYRFVNEHTIESNILKKANQKRQLDSIIIQEGDFTTDYFTRLSVKDFLGSEASENSEDSKALLSEASTDLTDSKKLELLLAHAEDEDDVMAARLAMKEVEVDDGDFKEGSAVVDADADPDQLVDEYEGTNHVEEYMIRFIANGYLYV